MKIFEFGEYSTFLPLYNEFLCSTEYIHSIRNRQNARERRDPYTPSLFIYSYFTFNTLYNINWEYTSHKRYCKLYFYRPWKDKENKKHYYSETDKIEFYHKFLNKVYRENFLNEFRANFMTYINNYRKSIDESRKITKDNGFYDDTIANWIEEHLKQFKTNFKTQLDETAKKDLLNIVEAITANSIQHPSSKEFNRLLEIIYLVRCNLFHGSKTPRDFDGSQMERFVIYSAVLSSLNYMLFLHLSTLDRR